MNGSNRPTQLAESQPEPDSKPPDPVQHTRPCTVHAMQGNDTHQEWALHLSTNKMAQVIFIRGAAGSGTANQQGRMHGLVESSVNIARGQ